MALMWGILRTCPAMTWPIEVADPAINVPATPEQVNAIKVQRLPYRSAIKAIGGPATPCRILTELIIQVALVGSPTVLQLRVSQPESVLLFLETIATVLTGL